MDTPNLEPPGSPLPSLTPYQKTILNHLCLYHQKGLTPSRSPITGHHLILLLAYVIPAIAILILLATRLSPLFTTLLAGYLLGWLVTALRYRRDFHRQWPLFDALIDWKLANHLRRESGILDDQVP